MKSPENQQKRSSWDVRNDGQPGMSFTPLLSKSENAMALPKVLVLSLDGV
jgi:hypothetical protein